MWKINVELREICRKKLRKIQKSTNRKIECITMEGKTDRIK